MRLLQDLPPGHPLERPLLVYIARVYGSIEEADIRQAVEQTRPEQAEALVMTVAEQWVQRGRQEGRQEGGVELLLWQIREKFGSEAAERYRRQVEQADEETIRTWSVRLLRAETIEDVFTGD